ncbi:MAG: zinc-ribbon domain-containing protein [Lachnospiraceae bacterium]|nr:zinc-ribbon domain-containing protein [Lachnospiraceae bacterium]
MAFCNQCGAQLQDGAAFCPACGAQQGVAPQPAQAPQQQAPQKSFQETFQDIINNTADFTAQMDPADIEANKTYAILSYLWVLFLVPIFAAPQSKFAKFHANQGLVLCICWVLASILLVIPIICYLSYLLYLVGLGYMAIGIINANNGKAKELPFIGKIRILK